MKIKDEALEYAKRVLDAIVAYHEVPIGGEQMGNWATIEEARDRIITALAAPTPVAEHVEKTTVGEVSHEAHTTTFEAAGEVKGRQGLVNTTVATGGFVSYYLAIVVQPQRVEQAPYTAECEDIIQTLGMTFDEGCEFKAIWRTAAARQGNTKPGHNALYDAEKRVHYATRSLRYEQWMGKQAKEAVPLMFRGVQGSSGTVQA